MWKSFILAILCGALLGVFVTLTFAYIVKNDSEETYELIYPDTTIKCVIVKNTGVDCWKVEN